MKFLDFIERSFIVRILTINCCLNTFIAVFHGILIIGKIKLAYVQTKNDRQTDRDRVRENDSERVK